MLIHVEHGKGGRDRYAMLSHACWAFCAPTGGGLGPLCGCLPGQEPGTPVGTGALQAACRVARRQARISKPVTAHPLRHSFATHLLESGTDIRIIQVLLGHVELASTAPYAQVATNLIAGTPSPFDRLSLVVVPPA